MYAIIFHAHQKIDRVAMRLLRQLDVPDCSFPSTNMVLHYEGKRGPDATRLKNSPNIDQPWHFIDPFDEDDDNLIKTIGRHYNRLVVALAKTDTERAAFEAAWLAHALVDGLTPAHHYPYEQELEELHGEQLENLTKLRSKFFVSGETKRESLRRSLKIMGPGGLLTTHTLFEAGAYTILRPMRLNNARPTAEDIEELQKLGLERYFRYQAKEVGSYRMFEQFLTAGWTPKLARIVRRELAPRMVKMVALAWYSAMLEAQKVRSA